MLGGDKYKIGPNKEKRLTRVSCVVPFCLGSFAYHLGKKALSDASHAWVVYVRAPDNTDLSHVIKKVSFTLHASFPQPVREITQAPFEVVEKGWGEFDVAVKIEFADDTMEPPLKLAHRLKLYENDSDVGKEKVSKKPVIRELYDELVFWEPTEAFYERIKNHQPRLSKPSEEANLESQLPKYSEQSDLNQMLVARNRIAEERARVSSMLQEAEGFH